MIENEREMTNLFWHGANQKLFVSQRAKLIDHKFLHLHLVRVSVLA